MLEPFIATEAPGRLDVPAHVLAHLEPTEIARLKAGTSPPTASVDLVAYLAI